MKEAEKEVAEVTVKKSEKKEVTASASGTEKTESCDSGLPAPTNATIDATASPCVACANKRARD